MTQQSIMRRATTNDIPRLREVYEQAARHARRVGVIDWPRQITEQFVKDLMGSGSVYVCDDEDAIVAAFQVTKKGSSAIWDDDTEALYLHKIVTADSVRGQGFFETTLLPEMKILAGAHPIRIDCLAENARLKDFYMMRGFLSRGDVTFWSTKQGRELTVSRLELVEV